MIKFFGWICIVSWIAFGLYALTFTRMKEEDLSWRRGTIKTTPRFSEDEYGERHQMRFFVEEEELELSIAGSWLTDEVTALGVGSEIEYYVFTAWEDKFKTTRKFRSVYGLKQNGRVLISKERVLRKAQGPFYYLLAAGFFAMSFGVFYLMYLKKG